MTHSLSVSWFARTTAAWSALLFLLLPAVLFPLMREEVVPVRYPQGTEHGFLVLRTVQGTTIAAGDLIQTVRGDEVTLHMAFHFRDGSLDDETTVFTQRPALHLLYNHLVQRGPSFPQPVDLSIDVPKDSIVLRSPRDGHVEKISKQMNLPPGLANGLLLVLAENIPPASAKTSVPMAVSFNGGVRIVHLTFLPNGTAPFHVEGGIRRAEDFLVKVDIGGIVGLLAPLIGEQPHDIHVWILEGEAPAFVREEGQFYAGGPVWQVEQVSPVIP